MSPQAGKGWDLFLLYSWGAQAERMGRQREEASPAQPSLPGMWPQLGKCPCRPIFLTPCDRCCPLGVGMCPPKQADWPPAAPQLAPPQITQTWLPFLQGPTPRLVCSPAALGALCGMRKDGAAQPGPTWEVHLTGASANSG